MRLPRTTKRLRYHRRTEIEKFLIYRILISVMNFVKYTTRRLATTSGAPTWGSPTTNREGTPSGDRQSTTHGCYGKYRCPETESDSAVVTRTADFDGRGDIHTAEGGGGARPLSRRVYHVRYEPYLNLSLMVFRRTVYEMAVSVRRTLGRRWIC